MLRGIIRKSDECKKKIQLYSELRTIWEQHIMWGRSSVISAADNLGDFEYVEQQLYRNPSDFADFFLQYFSEEEVEGLKKLMEEHFIISSNLIDYKIGGDNDAFIAERQRWYDNADQTADYLANMNAYWNKREWQKLLYEHLDLTETEGIQRYNSEYAKDVQQYDEIQRQTMRMADYMAEGIILRFPYLF